MQLNTERPLNECKCLETEATVSLSASQWPEAYSSEEAGLALG